jgi:RNA polymerase sigma-70 factor (ECF subfamily)
MLGSLSEAEDAVQEAWLRLSRAETASIENLSGLTTIKKGKIAWIDVVADPERLRQIDLAVLVD